MKDLNNEQLELKYNLLEKEITRKENGLDECIKLRNVYKLEKQRRELEKGIK